MKACHKFYSKSSTLASTSHSNKSTSDHNKAESSKYYELNIGYSQEKECIQLHFTPQEAYKDDKENSLSAGETFSNNFAINCISETNKPQRNASALLTVTSSNDEKKEKRHKKPININLTSASLSDSSIKLTKTGENNDLANKRKMTLENNLADFSKDDTVVKHLKGRFKEASTDPKDVVIGVANKKVKSKKVQTSKNMMPIEEVSVVNKKKKNKGTYVEPQEIYSASNPNESLSTALIPSVRIKSSVSTKSSIIRKRKHRRKKHHRHHRHRSGEREGKVVHSVSSATLESHVLQELLPIKNKSKGLGFFFLKNKLVWPVHSKNYAGEDSHKDETISCIAEEINKCKTKIKKKVDNYKDLLEVRKQKRLRRGSTETINCEAIREQCKSPDNIDTVIIKKPDELNSSSELNVMVKKKHKRIKECSSNSANDKLEAAVETKLKKKHNRLRRDSRNELRKVVSSKIKHKDSKYKKIDAASNMKIRSSDGSTCSQKLKCSKTELEPSHCKNETDSKREKEGSAPNRHKKRSKSKYNESEILDNRAQHRDNIEENAVTVAEYSEVVHIRKKKHKKEKASNADLIQERDKTTKKMKNKKVDTHSLVNIKQKQSKHKRRKSSPESKRSKHSSKNDNNNSDAPKSKRHKSSNRDTKKSDEKKYTSIYEKCEDLFDESWDDRKSIKISRNQLREFLQEITGNVDISESKTEQTNTSHKDKTKSVRKEVSFSHLNLNPVAALYTVPALNIKAIERKSSALRTSPSTKEKKQAKSKKKGKELDELSVVSEAVTKKEKTLYVSGKRFQSKSSSRSGICLKNIDKVRKQMQQNGSFSVKGMQPRDESKPTRASSIHVAKKVVQHHRQKLEKVVLSVVEIKPAKFFAEGLESDKPNKTANYNHRGTSNIPLSKKRKNREAELKRTGGNSSEAASKSSASGITTIQAIYLAEDNLETKLTDENSRAAIMKNVTQPHVETPLIQQVVLSKDGPKRRAVQNKSSNRELSTNSNKVLKKSGQYQQDSSLERARMQIKKPNKGDCQKFLQTSPISSREPSTDGRSLTDDHEVVARSKANKNKYSSTRLKSSSISSIKYPKSYKSKTSRHTCPVNNGNVNNELKLNRIYYKPIPEASPSLSSGFSVTSIERYQMRDRNVFRNISNKKGSLQRSRQRSESRTSKLARNGQIINPRIKEYAKQCERKQRLSRDSSVSSKSSSGRGNSTEMYQGRTNIIYSHLIDSHRFLQQIYPKNQIKTNQSLNKNPYIVFDPLVENDSFQAVQGGQSKIKKQAAINIPTATSKLYGNQQVNKNSRDDAVDSHSSERPWHSLLADAEGYLSRVQSNLQDILSGDLTALTKITEETSQESMRYSNLSHSSRNTRRDSNFSCKKASNIDNTTDKQAIFIAQGNNFAGVNRKYQFGCGSNQEKKAKKKPTENLQAEDRFSGQTKHKKRNKSGTNYEKPDKIFSPYCVENGKILQIFNIDTMEEPTSTETKNLNSKVNRKSKENAVQNIQGDKRSSFKDVIVSPCTANNELEDTPVKDIKSSSEERDSGDTETTSSNDSGSRQLPVITISTHLNKATDQEQENTQIAFVKKDKSSNNISNDQDLIYGTNECNGFEVTDNPHPQTNSALLLEEVTADNVQNPEEELRESKIRLANSFKRSIMEELQTATFLQQNDDIMQLIVDNSNEEELVQLNEIISQNVSNLVKQKVRSMLHFEELSEPPDGNGLKRESSPTMCPKLDIQTETNKMKHYDNTTDVNTRESKCEDADNFNSSSNQKSIDTTQRENKKDTFVLVSKSSQKSNIALSKPKANTTFLVNPISDYSEDDYSSKKPPTVKVISNSTHIQLSQVTHRPLTNTTYVNSADSRDSSNRIASNIYNTQRGSEANLEFIQHSTSSDYNDYWEAKDKKPAQTSKIPRSKNTAIHTLEETPTIQTKPRTAPSGKEQQSRASSELFRSSMQFTKFCTEKQENKTNAGSSCSTMANSFRNKPSTCLFTKIDRKDNHMSTFEKRKQYGELLRRKQTRTRNQDCIYCCPQVFHFDLAGKIQSEKRVLPPRLTSPNLAGKYSEPSTSKQLAAVRVLSPKDRYGYEPHGTLDGHHASRIDYCNLCCSVCNKLCCCCKKRQVSDEDSSAFAAPHPTLATIIKPVPLDEQNKEKSANVHQTLTASLDQENAIKTKFKSKSDVSLFSKESGFSCGSFPHPNSTVSGFSIGHKSVCNSKSNVLYTTGSDKVFCSVGEPKRSLPYKSTVRALQLRERSASGSPVYNMKDSSTSKNLLQTMEQNNSASDCPNNVEKQPSVVLKTSQQVKSVKARQSVNTTKFIECQRKKSAESDCVSSRSAVGKGYRHKLKETKSLSYQNLQRYSQHISQLSDDLKKLNNLSEMPRVASISRNKFKKLVQYVEEHRKVKNNNTKQNKINDKKTQEKHATCLTRNNTAQATCNSKQSKETKNINSNRNVTKTNFQKKIYNNETINEQNKNVEPSSLSSRSSHSKSISYKRNNVQTKFLKKSPLENKCHDSTFTIFNSNKEIALKRKDTRILRKSDSEECFKIFAYNSIVKLEDNYSLTLPTYINGLSTSELLCCKNIEKSKLLCCDEYLYRNQKFLNNSSSASCLEITKNYYEKKKSTLLNTLFDPHDNFMHAFAHGDQELYNSKNFLLKPFPAIITLPVCVKLMGWAENKESSKPPKKPLPLSPNGAKLNHAVAKDDPAAHTSKRLYFDKSNRSHKVARKKQLDTKREQSKLPHRLDYRSVARKLLRFDHREFKSTQVSEAVWHSDCKDSHFPRKRTYTQLPKPLPRGRRSVGSATSSSTMLDQSNYGSRPLKQHADESSSSIDWNHKERKDQGTQCYDYVEIYTDCNRTTNCSNISLRNLLCKEVPSRNSLKMVKDNHLEGEARLSKTRASLFLILKKELLQALLSSNSFELTEDDPEELSVKAFGQTNSLPPTTTNSIELSGKATYTLLPVEKPIEISKKSTYMILPGRETYDEATYAPWPPKALREVSEKATYTLSQDSIETFEKGTHTRETSEKATYTVSPVKRLGKIYKEATLTLLPEKSTETFEKSTYTLPLDIELVDRGTYTMPSAVVSTEIFVRTTCTLSGDTLHSISDYSDSMQFLDNSQKEIVAETARKLMSGSFGNKPLLHEPKGKMYESATTVVNSSSIRDLVKGLFSKPSDELLDIEVPTSYTNVTAKSEEENIETIRQESTDLSSHTKLSMYDDEVPQENKKNLSIKTLNSTTEPIIEELKHTLEAKFSEVIDIKCKKLLDEAKNFNNLVIDRDEESSESHSKICWQQAHLFNKLLELDKEPLFVKARLEELHDIFLKNVKPLQSHKSNQAIHKELPIPDMPNKSFEQLIELKLKKAWLDKSKKRFNLLQDPDLTASQTHINTSSKKKAFISKPIKAFQNLFKWPGKKPTTELIFKQTQCPSNCVAKEVAHAASQQSTESSFEDEEELYKTKLHTTESALTILKKFLSNTFKERSKVELREAPLCADTPLMLSEKMVESPPKHSLNSSLKEFLTASLKDLPYLPNEHSQASVKMFEQKSAQTLLEELQEKFSNKFFSAVNTPLLLFGLEDVQKDHHGKCNAYRNCRNWRLCKTGEVSDDLLKKMSQMPLTAIVKLHEQQSNDQNPQMSFKTLVEDLYKDIQEDKLKVTESQECIVHVLKKSMKKDDVGNKAAQKIQQPHIVTEQLTDKERTVETSNIRTSISDGFISVTDALKYEEIKMKTNSQESNASKMTTYEREANRAESSSTFTPFRKESQELSPQGSRNKQGTIDRNVALTSDNGVDQNFNKTFVERKTDSSILIGKRIQKGYIKQNLLPTKEEDEDERSTSSNEKMDTGPSYGELKPRVDENVQLITGSEENVNITLVKGKNDHSESNIEVNKMWKSLSSKNVTKKEFNKSTSSKESWSSYDKFNENVERIIDYEEHENVSIASSKGKADNLASKKLTEEEFRRSSFDKEKKDSWINLVSKNSTEKEFRRSSLDKEKKDSWLNLVSRKSTEKEFRRSSLDKEKNHSWLSYAELNKKMDENVRSIRDHEENENVNMTSSAKQRNDNSDSGGEVNKQQNSPSRRRSTKRESRKSTSGTEKTGWLFNDESIKKMDGNVGVIRDYEKNENVSIRSAKGRSDSSDSVEEINKKLKSSSHRISTRKESKESTSGKGKTGSWLSYDEQNKKIDENAKATTDYEKNENVSMTTAKGKSVSSDSKDEINKKRIPSSHRRSTSKESRKTTDNWLSYDEPNKKMDKNTKTARDYENNENVSITSTKGRSDSSDSMVEVNKKPKSSSHRRSTRKESTKSTSGNKKTGWPFNDESIKKIDANEEVMRDYEKNKIVSIRSAKGRSDSSDSMIEVNKKPKSSSHRRSTRKESTKSTSGKENTGWPFNDESIKKMDGNEAVIRDYEKNENVSITTGKGKSDSSDSMTEVNKKTQSSSHRRSARKESTKSTSVKENTGWPFNDESIKKMNGKVSITSAKGRSDSSDSMDEVNKKRISSSHRRPTRKESRKSTDNWISYDEPNKKVDENTRPTKDYEKNENVSITSTKRRSDSSDLMDEANKKPESSSHRRSTRKESTKSTLGKEKTGSPFNDESIKKMDGNEEVIRDYEKNEIVSITSAKGRSDSSDSTNEVNKKPKLSTHLRSTGKEYSISTSGKEKTDSWPSYEGSKQKVNVNVALTSENDIVRPDNSDSNSERHIKRKSLSSKKAANKEYAKSNSKRWPSHDKSNQKVARIAGSENELNGSFDLPSVAGHSDSFVSEGEIDKRGRTKQKSMKKADLEKSTSSKTKSVSSPSFSSSTSIEQIKEKVYRKKRDLDNKINKRRSKHASLEEDSGSATLDDEKTVPSEEANSKRQSQNKSSHLKKDARSLEVDDNSGTILKEKQGFSTLVSCACAEKTSNALQQLKEALTDKELFEKLLNSYEREERIVERLSNDEEFIKSQLELIRKKRAGVRDTNADETLPTTSTLAKIQEEDEERELRTVKKVSEEKVEKKRDAATAVLEGKEASTSTNGPVRHEERTLSVVGKGASQSTVSVTKSQSKTKSGFKSRVTRMFGIGTNDNEQMKEIVAPREEKRDSIDEKLAEAASEDNQKVKFRKGGDPFEEEKKMLTFSNTSLLRPHFAKAERRPSQDSNDSNIIKPSDLGKSFLRGFRTDHVALDGDTCLFITKAERERRLRPNLYKEAMIEFSERDSPLEYLLALGFSIDEASNAIKDEDVKNRLFAAITEARIWVNQISTVQGTLLYLVSYKTKPKTMRYFLQLVEAIINKRINNAVKLNSFLRVLEKVEDGDLTMIHILGSDKFDDEENEEKVIKKQLRQLFIDVYKIAEYEAALKGITVSKEGTVLLRIMAAKYRAGLHPHLELIARYIGQGLIKTEVQLEAAMIYLSRLDTADVNLKEFEQYCAIRCKQDQKPGAKK